MIDVATVTPSRRALALAVLWILFAVLGSVRPLLMWAWVATGVLIALALVLDFALTLRRPALRVERKLARSVALDASTQVVLRACNPSSREVRAILFEAQPPTFELDGLPAAVTVPADGWTEVQYRLRATRRGQFELGSPHAQQRSLLGLWWRAVSASDEQSVRVYPNFLAVARYALLATSDRTSEFGIRKMRRRGEGTEFHQLREYRPGDPLRQIDWRATSRLLRPMSRDYREEQDQQLLLLLDCGRPMRAQDGDLNHLDHALNAGLLLAHVALRQGDAVGLITYGGVDRSVAPRKGMSHLVTLLNATFDLDTSTEGSDMAAAVESALRHLRRRTLIVLLTNIRDEPDAEVLSVLRFAGRRHVVLLAALREAAIGKALVEPPTDFDGALRVAGSYVFLRHRAASRDNLERAGLHCIDAEPSELAPGLVNRYLAIKASHLL
jgi:uncharacterized protein (DUF58 family)